MIDDEEARAAIEAADAQPFTEPETVSAKVLDPSKPGVVDTIASTIANDASLADAIAYNTAENAIYLRSAVPWDPQARDRRWGDIDSYHLCAYLQTEYGFKGTDKDLRKGLYVRACANEYDTIADALDALPEWDSYPRVGNMIRWYLGAEHSDYLWTVEGLLFAAIVRRAYEPGAKFDYMPVLIGAQGLGKSTFLQRLALRPDFFTDDIRAFGSKEFAEQVQGKTVVEVSELSALKRSQVEAVKAAITRTHDQYRKPYAEFPEMRPRRCVLVGTTNDPRFLTDDSGNRRFLPIQCGAIDPELDLFAEEAPNEFKQAFAEAVAEYKGGTARANLTLPADVMEAARDAQEEAHIENPWIEQAHEWLDHKAPDRVCARQICNEALGIEQPSRYQLNEVRSIMEREFPNEWRAVKAKQRIVGYGTQRCFERVKQA